MSPVYSKLKLKRQLDRARSANLVERAETAVSATGPQTVRQGLRRAAKQRAGQGVDGIAEVRVVKDVEELSAKTKAYRGPGCGAGVTLLHGLPGMHERATLLGGKLAVWSELNSGTEAELTIPASVAYAKSPVERRSMSSGQ